MLLYLARTDKESFADPVTVGLHFTFTTANGDKMRVGGEVSSKDSLYSTGGNASSWVGTITGKTPVGKWELVLPNTPEMRELFKKEEIEDILFVLTYSGRTPAWPV